MVVTTVVTTGPSLQFCTPFADEENMLYRLVIDVLRSKMELQDATGGFAKGLKTPPTVLDIRVNRFTPGDFVFRCKVVDSR